MHLALPQVTLVAIDTRAPALAAQSLLRSLAQVDFGRAILFTNAWLPPMVLPGIEIIDIAPIHSGAEYSQFVLRELPLYIRSSHVLVTQWDGFVTHAAAWRDEFLVHDYIGSVWPEQPAACNVGNGGFSLRSRRLLMAGMDPHITQTHPEDEVLCRTQRRYLEQRHGVSFAPAALARRFSFENEKPGAVAFGFHGPYHLPRFFDEATMALTLKAMPDAFFRSRDARRLARALLAQRMPGTAQQLVRRRQAAGMNDGKTWLLGVAAAALRLLAQR